MKPLDLHYLDRLLEPLQNGQLVVFSASCATRILPVYLSFYERTKIGDPDFVQNALMAVWRSCSGGGTSTSQHEDNLAILNEMRPKEIDRTPLLEYGADAIGAVVCAIRSLLFEDFQDATWSAQYVQESVARYLINTNSFKHVKGAALGDELATFKLMNAECSRQEGSVAELLKIGISIPPESIARFRSRAEQEPALPDLKPDFEPLYRQW